MTTSGSPPSSLDLPSLATPSGAGDGAVSTAPEQAPEAATFEDAPARGAFRELRARRQAARAQHRGAEMARGEQVQGRMTALRTLREAITSGVRDLVADAELTDEQVQTLEDATRELHASMRDVGPTLRAGETDGVGEQVSEAIGAFLDTVDEVLGQHTPEATEPVEPVPTEQPPEPEVALAESFADELPPFDDDQEIWEPMEILEDSITHALEGFLQSIQDPGEPAPPNPYADYFAAVQSVTDPSAEALSVAIGVA